jgi:hypothetical protein
MDSASDFGSEGHGFDSRLAHVFWNENQPDLRFVCHLEWKHGSLRIFMDLYGTWRIFTDLERAAARRFCLHETLWILTDFDGSYGATQRGPIIMGRGLVHPPFILYASSVSLCPPSIHPPFILYSSSLSSSSSIPPSQPVRPVPSVQVVEESCSQLCSDFCVLCGRRVWGPPMPSDPDQEAPDPAAYCLSAERCSPWPVVLAARRQWWHWYPGQLARVSSTWPEWWRQQLTLTAELLLVSATTDWYECHASCRSNGRVQPVKCTKKGWVSNCHSISEAEQHC